MIISLNWPLINKLSIKQEMIVFMRSESCSIVLIILFNLSHDPVHLMTSWVQKITRFLYQTSKSNIRKGTNIIIKLTWCESNETKIKTSNCQMFIFFSSDFIIFSYNSISHTIFSPNIRIVMSQQNDEHLLKI